MLDLLLVLVLGHLVADFIFQSDNSCQRKFSPIFKKRVIANLSHVGIYTAINVVLLASMNLISLPNVIALGGLALAHGIVDFGKYFLNERVKDFYLLLADQVLHMLVILVAVSMLFHGELSKFAASVIAELKGFQSVASIINDTQRVLILLSMLIFVTAGANVLIRSILQSLNIKMTFRKDSDSATKRDAIKTGRYIGAIERILTVFALLAGSYESIIALYASKTAIRFKQVSDDFQEYYILGTLISLLIGIASGVFLKIVL